MLDFHRYVAALGDYRFLLRQLGLAIDVRMPADPGVGGQGRDQDARPGERPHLLVGLSRVDGPPIYGTGTEIDGVHPWPGREPGVFAARPAFEGVALLPGEGDGVARALEHFGLIQLGTDPF